VNAQFRHLIGSPLRFLASRAGSFVVLAFLVAVQDTYASTLAASQFLARIGAQGVPLYYVLNAAVSIPFAALFSSVIDRFPRRRLFAYGLGLFTIIMIVLAVLPPVGKALPYANYLIVRTFEHLIYSFYYILVADYFTVTENKRHAGHFVSGIAAGGLIGGGLLTAMTSFAGPTVAALVTPALVAVALVFASWTTKRQHPLDAAVPASRESLAESLRILPRLIRRYPMISLMSAAMFLNILLQCIAEFLAFSIYTIHFPRIDQLAVFLGLVNAGMSVLVFLVIVLFTGRQLARLGVPKMNRVYPALELLTFGILTISPSLPAGVLANISYNPFKYGIDDPVMTMNYNAIRHRFVGRVRVFIDGMIFPLGLASAGLLLLGFAGWLDLRVVAAFGLVLSMVLLALHWNIGRQYASGLIEMLRDGAVELDQVDHGLRLPSEQIEEIRAMLAGDPRTALMGLEMAARCDGKVPPDEIAKALAKIPMPQARRILTQFTTSGIEARRDVVEQLAEIGPQGVRRLAWEHILCEGAATAARARPLLEDEDEGVRCVAAAAVLIADPTDPAAQQRLTGRLSAAAAIGALHVLAHATGRDALGTIGAIGRHSDPAVRAAALAAAENCAADSPALADWARQAISDPEPTVRQGAMSLLVRSAPEAELGEIAEKFLDDPWPEVRYAAAQALGARGETAVPAICGQLRRGSEDAQLAAIDALHLAIGPAAADRLYDELNVRLFAPIASAWDLARFDPTQYTGGPELRAALDNARRRALRVVMHVHDTLGHRRTLDLVRTMINSRDERARANAIETLASLPQRRFVIPILPLIETGETAEARPGLGQPDPASIEEALSSLDPWLRAAAAVAWHARTGGVPERVQQDPSSIVTETVRELALRPVGNCSYRQEVLMSRLAFLHDVRLFADTSLDDLIAVDHVLGLETYLAGEPIVREGEVGDRLCVVHSGRVEVQRGGHVLRQLGAGDYFGEMALFDDGPRSATVTAIDEVEVLVLLRDRFHSLVRQRPSMLMEVCATLVRRLREAEQEAQPTG
jgi:hypothetical protein